MADIFYKALIFIICLDVILFLGQVAVVKINPDSQVHFFDYSGSLTGKYDSGNYTLNTGSPGSLLPTDVNTVNQDTGNIFTDTWSSVKNWFTESTGLNYLFAFFGGPATYVRYMIDEPEFVYAIGAAWMLITVLVVIGFIRGA